MLFSRQKYLDKLIAHKHNHQIKVTIGLRQFLMEDNSLDI